MDLTVTVPRLPRVGETIQGNDFYQAAGGKGGNQAVAAARQEATVRMVGRVGKDAFGEVLKRGLEVEGVDAKEVEVVDGPSGLALIFVAADGQNQIAVVPGANSRLTPEDVDRLSWGTGAWAVAQLEVPEAAVIRGFHRARSAGGRTVLNAAPARHFSVDLWSLSDLLVVNESEAALLSGQPVNDPSDALAAARVLQARGPLTVAVTLGPQGSALVSSEGAWLVPALQVHSLDATGAGDAWVGAFVTLLAEGKDLISAATFASAAGALAVTRPGAQPSLPRRKETEVAVDRVPEPQRLL